jgi:hypothetical protein
MLNPTGCWVVLCLALGAAPAFGQSPQLSARELYYREDAPAKPVTAATPAAAPVAKPAAPKTPKPSASKPVSVPAASGVTTPSGVPVVQAALHLGVRYNVLQWSADRQKRAEVDPEKRFKTGDCFSLRFVPNRDGYVYVFSLGSSGRWTPLLPADPSEPPSMVRANTAAEVPAATCIRFEDPPGDEKLVVVVTERKEDFEALNESIRESVAAPASPARKVGETRLMADNRLTKQLEAMGGGGLSSRDLVVEKTAAKQSGGEPPYSVYAVSTASAKGQHMILQIRLRHD